MKIIKTLMCALGLASIFMLSSAFAEYKDTNESLVYLTNETGFQNTEISQILEMKEQT